MECDSYDFTSKSSGVLPPANAALNQFGRLPCPVQALPASSRYLITPFDLVCLPAIRADAPVLAWLLRLRLCPWPLMDAILAYAWDRNAP